MELNVNPMVINLNAHYIDKYLCIHIYELIVVLDLIHSDYFSFHNDIKNHLDKLQKEMKTIITDFFNETNSEGIDISLAPEISRIR